MPNSNKITNEQGLFAGQYRAIVVNNKHPDKWHMAQVRVISVSDDIPAKDLPWAEYKLPLGARPKEGDMMPAQVGDLVWVSFMHGDTRFPIIEGSCYRVDGEGTGESLLPQDAWRVECAHKRTGKQPEPPKHEYGDRVMNLLGFLEQFTMSGEWCLTHLKTGTGVHINEKGEFVVHVEHNAFESVEGNKLVEVKKKIDYVIGGDASRTVKGKDVIAITGSRTVKAKTIKEDAQTIQLNGGMGVVTQECICHFTGKPHGDGSSTVFAGK